MIRFLKVLCDRWRSWFINQYSWFYHSILPDFETQVLRMIRVVYAEWSRYSICKIEPRLDHSRFFFLQTLFLAQEQVLKRKSILLAYFRDSGIPTFLNPWSSVFPFVNLARDPLYIRPSSFPERGLYIIILTNKNWKLHAWIEQAASLLDLVDVDRTRESGGKGAGIPLRLDWPHTLLEIYQALRDVRYKICVLSNLELLNVKPDILHDIPVVINDCQKMGSQRGGWVGDFEMRPSEWRGRKIRVHRAKTTN